MLALFRLLFTVRHFCTIYHELCCILQAFLLEDNLILQCTYFHNICVWFWVFSLLSRINYNIVVSVQFSMLIWFGSLPNQDGKETETSMDHFLLCGENQLHDLHTKLLLSHPGGCARQLHKCIAAHPGARGVFDGNVKVTH